MTLLIRRTVSSKSTPCPPCCNARILSRPAPAAYLACDFRPFAVGADNEDTNCLTPVKNRAVSPSVLDTRVVNARISFNPMAARAAMGPTILRCPAQSSISPRPFAIATHILLATSAA